MSLGDFERRENKNFQNKCKYLLAQIKVKDKKVWEELNEEFQNEVYVDETWEFSEKLIKIYNDLN
jgi:hypothetical protein